MGSRLSEQPKRRELETQMRTRYLALGDSYTIGEGVPEADRFPVQLTNRLAAEGFAHLAAPEIVAKTGWTTDELAAGIDAAGPAGTFELVTLLIGVNNQYRGRPLEECREQFRELLQRAIRFAAEERGRVIVVSIPDWGVTPFAAGRDRAAIAREIDAFNCVTREEADREGVRYVDITPVSRRAGEEPNLVADDGLHPSAGMYRLWVELLRPEAVAALSGS